MGENKCALGDHSEGTQTKDMIWGGGRCMMIRSQTAEDLGILRSHSSGICVHHGLECRETSKEME